jgi:hypothetical protein
MDIESEESQTFFRNCLWMASSASLIVTPFRFRAVTSRPSGKWRSIFLTGGVVSIFFRYSLSSTVFGDLFSFLKNKSQFDSNNVNARSFITSSAFVFPWQ